MNEHKQLFHFHHDTIEFHQYNKPNEVNWLGWYEFDGECIAFVTLEGDLVFEW